LELQKQLMRCFESYPMGSGWKHHVQTVFPLCSGNSENPFGKKSVLVALNMNLQNFEDLTREEHRMLFETSQPVRILARSGPTLRAPVLHFSD
jgi:hypothetical protein